MTRQVFTRPNLPYAGDLAPFSNRYHILTVAKKPLKAEHLDGEINYIVDSLNQLSIDITNVQAGIVQGSDLRANKDKLLTTDGQKNPLLTWIKVKSNSIEDNAIESNHIFDNAVTREKIVNDAIDNSKIAQNAITAEKINGEYDTKEEKEDGLKDWGLKIGSSDIVPGALSRWSPQGKLSAFELSCYKLLADEAVAAPLIKAEKIDAKNYLLNGQDLKYLIDKFVNDMQEKFEGLEYELFNDSHPIGSLSFTNPKDGQTIHGKTIKWEKIEGDRVLVTTLGATGELSGSVSAAVGQTGQHVLTEEEMPKHSHAFKMTTETLYQKRKYITKRYIQDAPYLPNGEPGLRLGNIKMKINASDSFKDEWPTGDELSNYGGYLGVAENGGNQPHSHPLDLKRITITLYRRIS